MRFVVTAALFLILPSIVSATHLRGGQITYRRVNCSTNTYEIRVTVLTDTGSPVKFGGASSEATDVLEFGDGERVTVPETNHIILSGYPGVGVASYTVLHTYTTPGAYRITYTEPNRNDHIINMNASVMTPFSIESLLIVNDECPISSPVSLSPSVFVGNINTNNTFALAQQSSNGYRLQYTLVTPRQGPTQNVDGYVIPAGVSLDPDTGILTWEKQNSLPAGEYAFSVRVQQFEGGSSRGYVTSDIQIMMKDGVEGSTLHTTAQLNSYNRVYATTDGTEKVKVIAQNTQGYPELLLYAEVHDVTLESYDSTAESKYMKVGILTFVNTGASVRTKPYVITVRGFFDPANANAVRYSNDITFLFFTEDVPLDEVVTDIPNEMSREIYPNPTTDRLTLPERTRYYRVMDLKGTCVQQGSASGTVSISDLPQGVYLLQGFNDTFDVQITRFVKR